MTEILDLPPPPDPPRMTYAPPPPDPNLITLLDYFAGAILMAGLGVSASDIFDKAAAMVAESHRRKGFIP